VREALTANGSAIKVFLLTIESWLMAPEFNRQDYLDFHVDWFYPVHPAGTIFY